jgi:hypothetical protein
MCRNTSALRLNLLGKPRHLDDRGSTQKALISAKRSKRIRWPATAAKRPFDTKTFASCLGNEAELSKVGSERIDQLRALTD